MIFSSTAIAADTYGTSFIAYCGNQKKVVVSVDGKLLTRDLHAKGWYFLASELVYYATDVDYEQQRITFASIPEGKGFQLIMKDGWFPVSMTLRPFGLPVKKRQVYIPLYNITLKKAGVTSLKESELTGKISVGDSNVTSVPIENQPSVMPTSDGGVVVFSEPDNRFVKLDAALKIVEDIDLRMIEVWNNLAVDSGKVSRHNYAVFPDGRVELLYQVGNELGWLDVVSKGFAALAKESRPSLQQVSPDARFIGAKSLFGSEQYVGLLFRSDREVENERLQVRTPMGLVDAPIGVLDGVLKDDAVFYIEAEDGKVELIKLSSLDLRELSRATLGGINDLLGSSNAPASSMTNCWKFHLLEVY